MNFDEKDKKLRFLLQEDADKTNKFSAGELNLSVTAVFERIKKLEKQKVIKKYIALVDKKQLKRDFHSNCAR
ncbi:Lrp/AsnC family transcriptional regulator [Halpernia sp. GG3]